MSMTREEAVAYFEDRVAWAILYEVWPCAGTVR